MDVLVVRSSLHRLINVFVRIYKKVYFVRFHELNIAKSDPLFLGNSENIADGMFRDMPCLSYLINR